MFSYFSKNKHTKRIIPKSATRKQKLLSFKKKLFSKKDNANNFSVNQNGMYEESNEINRIISGVSSSDEEAEEITNVNMLFKPIVKEVKEINCYSKEKKMPEEGWFFGCYCCGSVTSNNFLFKRHETKKVIYYFNMYLCDMCEYRSNKNLNANNYFNKQCNKFLREDYPDIFNSR